MVPTFARAQSLAFDLQTRIPGLSYGDLTLVRGTRVLPHAASALALDLDAVHRPFVVVDPTLGTSVDVVETRSTFTFMYGVGLFDHLQATLAVPLAFQRGAGIEAFSGNPDDRLSAGAVADLRLDIAYMPLTKAPRLGPLHVDFAFAGGVLAPTGDESSFTGSSTWSGYVDAMGSARWGDFTLNLQAGARFRETANVLDVSWGSQVLFAGGVGFHLFDDHLIMAAEAHVLLGLTHGPANPAQALAEARVILDEERTAIVFGFGGGLNGDLGAPEWQIVAAFRHAPGTSGSPLARALSGEYAREAAE
jgi:hypothetical protein